MYNKLIMNNELLSLDTSDKVSCYIVETIAML